MNTEAPSEPLLSQSPGERQRAKTVSTERVRAHRERRRSGRWSVRIQVDKNSIEALVKLDYLQAAQAHDLGAIRDAVEFYLSDAPFMPAT